MACITRVASCCTRVVSCCLIFYSCCLVFYSCCFVLHSCCLVICRVVLVLCRIILVLFCCSCSFLDKIVFKTLRKKTYFIRSKTLLELTSTKIYFKDFGNTLIKRKIQAKRFRKFQNGAFRRK